MREVKQLAQMLIFEFSQQAVARGGQAIFTDLNLYWEVPKHFRDVPAIGPGGEFTGKTYSDYLKEAQRFVMGALRGLSGRGRRRTALLLPQAAGPHHREVLPDARSRGFPRPYLRRRRGKGEHLFRLRPRGDGQDLGVLPAQLQAGGVRPGGCPAAVEDALLRPAERHAQPAAHRLRGRRGRYPALCRRSPEFMETGGQGPPREEGLHRTSCFPSGRRARSRCSP